MSLLDRAPTWLRVGRLGQNALYGSVGLGVRAVIQAAYLILLSRWMGAQGYGLFAGSVAAVMLVAPLSGWGISYVLSQGVARDHAVSRPLWATALVQTLLTGALLAAVAIVGTAFGMTERLSIVSMLLIALAELVILPMAQTCTSLCFALDRGIPAAIAICIVPVGRLLMALVLVAMGAAGTPSTVAFSHFMGSIAGIIGSVLLIACLDGWPAWRKRWRLEKTLSRGTAYAVGAVVGTSYMEVDKVLMLELLGAAVVGPYTAAFRVASVFALPISALMSAALPRLFASRGGDQGRNTLKTIALASFGYGLVATVGAACISPLMPFIFGSDFADASKYLVWLAPWPVLFALHQTAATGLTGFDRQRARVLIESGGLILVTVLNASLLKIVGAEASVLALLAGEAFMGAACWGRLEVLKRRRI